jgi:hypothetical protein
MKTDTTPETNMPDSVYDPPGYQTSYQIQQEPLIPTRYVVIGVITSLVLMVLFLAFVVWAATYHATTIEALRDIFIIVLALESCIFGIALMILLIMVIRLVNMLEFEIKPILERTNETIGMVRGTTVFMSENVVKPMTTASSYAAGVRRGLKTLFGNPKNNLES